MTRQTIIANSRNSKNFRRPASLALTMLFLGIHLENSGWAGAVMVSSQTCLE